MERETLEFDNWLRTVEAETANLEFVDLLNELALLASRDFGVRLWFVEILGRRWSYLAGEMPEQSPRSDTQRIELQKNIGLVSDSWEKLSEGSRNRLIVFLNRLVAEKSTVPRI